MMGRGGDIALLIVHTLLTEMMSSGKMVKYLVAMLRGLSALF